jgi:hypothetical protein
VSAEERAEWGGTDAEDGDEGDGDGEEAAEEEAGYDLFEPGLLRPKPVEEAAGLVAAPAERAAPAAAVLEAWSGARSSLRRPRPCRRTQPTPPRGARTSSSPR